VALVTVLASIGVLFGPSVAAIAGGLLLAFVLPGLALTVTLFRGRTLTSVERTVLAPALSLAVVVVSGLVLHVLGVALDRYAWTIATTVVTLGALVVPAVPLPRPDQAAAKRAADLRIAELAAAAKLATVGIGERRSRISAETIESLRPPPKPPVGRIVRQLVPMVLVLALLGGAGWLSFVSSHRAYDVTVTALSAGPPGAVDAAGHRAVAVTVSGMVAADGPYLLMVVDNGGAELDRRKLAANRDTWTARMLIGRVRTTISLYRARDSGAYRTITIAAAQ
jgi:hypothetical protein